MTKRKSFMELRKKWNIGSVESVMVDLYRAGLEPIPVKSVILALLRDRGPLTGMELATDLGLSDRQIDRHLAALRRAGLVEVAESAPGRATRHRAVERR